METPDDPPLTPLEQRVLLVASALIIIPALMFTLAMFSPALGPTSPEAAMAHYMRELRYEQSDRWTGRWNWGNPVARIAIASRLEVRSCDTTGACLVRATLPQEARALVDGNDQQAVLAMLSGTPFSGEREVLDIPFQMERTGIGGFSRGNVPDRFLDFLKLLVHLPASGDNRAPAP